MLFPTPSHVSRQDNLEAAASGQLVGQPQVEACRKGPPIVYLLLPYFPLGLAIFIAGTRYFDFRNHAFDVLVGAAIGVITAWWGFKLYGTRVGCEAESVVEYCSQIAQGGRFEADGSTS